MNPTNSPAAVEQPNRATRRAGLHTRQSSRETQRDQTWQHTLLRMAAAYPADLGENLDGYVVKVRRLAAAEVRWGKRTARRRVRLARSHGKKLGRPQGRRFPVPTLGRPH